MKRPDFRQIASDILDRSDLEAALEAMYDIGFEDGDAHGWEVCVDWSECLPDGLDNVKPLQKELHDRLVKALDSEAKDGET